MCVEVPLRGKACGPHHLNNRLLAVTLAYVGAVRLANYVFVCDRRFAEVGGIRGGQGGGFSAVCVCVCGGGGGGI